MGSKSLAEKFYMELEVENASEYTWAVLYDFHGKPSSNFWDNLKRLREMLSDVGLEQKSVFRTTDLKGALTAERLARHYGADTVIYKVEELDPLNPDLLGSLSGYKLGPSQGWLVMKAVRFKLEKLPPSSEEYVTLMNVLRRFHGQITPMEEDLEDKHILYDTRGLLEEKTVTDEVEKAWVSRGESWTVLKAFWDYLLENKDNVEENYYNLPSLIMEDILHPKRSNP